LREALAAANHDFLLRDDDRPARRNSRRGKGKGKNASGLFGFRLGRAARLFLVFGAVAAIGVPLNALYFQDGRHPAPLFGFVTAGGQGAGAKRVATLPPPAAEAPLPPPRPATVAAPPSAPAKPAAKAPAAKSESGRAEKPGDAIGALLASTAPAPAPSASAAPGAEKADKSVLFAQRALAKMGYGLRADGVYGGTTRQAVEKFERAIGAPVKGELTPKVLRQLAARSGLSAQ